MISKINRCDIYVILSVLYILQGALYRQGIINQSLQIILMLWALFATSKEIGKVVSESKILKATSMLVAMYFVYGVVFIISGKVYQYGNGGVTSSYGYLQSSLNSLLPIFLFYYYTRKGYIDNKRIQLYGILFLLAYVIDYQYNLQQMVSYYADLGSNRQEFTNNSSYLFLLLFPFLYFYRSKWIQGVFVLLILYFLLIGMKRGAVMIGILCLLIYLIHNWNQIKRSRYLAIYALGAVIIAAGFTYYMSNTLSGSDYFRERVQQTLEGDSSGRDVIYSVIWNEVWANGSILQLIIGRGANSTVEVTNGWFAHQDWLETLCNNGLLGVFLLSSFYLSIYKECKLSKNSGKRNIYEPLIMMLVICVTKSFFSMSVQDMQVCQTMILGYCSYHVYNEEYNNCFCN